MALDYCRQLYLDLWVECSQIARETGVQSQVESYQRLDASLLNTLHYKVRIKGKMEQSRERSRSHLYTKV